MSIFDDYPDPDRDRYLLLWFFHNYPDLMYQALHDQRISKDWRADERTVDTGATVLPCVRQD